MLCPSCRRLLTRGAPLCGSCGAQVADAVGALQLVLSDGTRVPLVETISIGRAPGNGIQLADRSVSRSHARVEVSRGAAVLADAGSSHGTFLDGGRVTGAKPLGAGSRIRLGDVEIGVEAGGDAAAAGRTVVVRQGQSLAMPGADATEVADSASITTRPKVRAGWALKPLPAPEGERRFVLRDLRGDGFMRMGEDEAELFRRLDGRSSLVDLVAEAEQRLGPSGPGRLLRLLADLGEHGMLEGVEAGARTAPPVDGVLARVLRPRERVFAWAPGLFERLYGRGGFVLFTAPALALICALALAGLSAFGYLVAGRYGTPFVVAGKLGLGGLTFLLGRLAVVALHETAHGLALAAVGRRAGRAGIKLLLVFPYAFVDTSEAWFETRSRRIAVAVAGPLSDAAVGGAFALGCLAAPPGTLRDVLFQLAFVAYLGAFLNMNPLLDRDGYHILVDVLNEPGLRRRSRRRLGEALAGRPASGESATLLRYGVASVIWLLAAAGFAIVLSLRYYDRLVALAPREAVIAVFAGFWLMLLVPVMMIVGRPLVAGRRRMMSEVRRVRL